MSRGVAIAITFAAGLVVGLQPAANSTLSDHVGDFGAAFVSVTVTFIVVAVLLLTRWRHKERAGFFPKVAVNSRGA